MREDNHNIQQYFDRFNKWDKTLPSMWHIHYNNISKSILSTELGIRPNFQRNSTVNVHIG